MTGDPAVLSVEALSGEIDRIVAERQQLRDAKADTAELEQNRRRLAGAQSQLSLLLIERHLVRA
jgi:phage terminase Nu1 subunit (DNA packaging protein)